MPRKGAKSQKTDQKKHNFITKTTNCLTRSVVVPSYERLTTARVDIRSTVRYWVLIEVEVVAAVVVGAFSINSKVKSLPLFSFAVTVKGTLCIMPSRVMESAMYD